MPNDPVFTIAAENQAHADVALSNPARSVGKPVFDVFPDNSKKFKDTGESDLLNSFRKVIKTGKPDVMPLLHYDIKDENGEFVEKWWQVSHHPLFDAAGTLVMLYQLTEDVTEQRVNTQQLESTQSQLNSALDIGLVSTWSWDITSDIVVADRNLALSFGIDPKLAAIGELPLKVFTDSIHEEDRQQVVQAIENAVQHDVVYEQEYRTVVNKDDIRWVIARGRLQKDVLGKKTYLVGVIVDITKRKEAEIELEETKKMFNALFESTMLSIALADMKGNVIRANKTFLRTFGYNEEDLKNVLTSQKLTSKKSIGITNKLYDDLRIHGEARPVEKEYIRKDGTTLPMLVGAAMLPNSQDDHFIAYMLDISENKELKELNKTKDEFIGMASHQLRTPATTVKQYLSLLNTGFAGLLTQEQKSYVDKAYIANERQLVIVNDLLKTAQIDSDRFIIKKQKLQINTIVTAAVDEFRETISRKQQTVSVTDNTDSHLVYADKVELNLVLANLIENASKYSPKKVNIEVILSSRSKYVCIEIKDKGVGIAPKDQAKIFEKFTRVNNKLSNTVNGSGLGLYWVKRIIELHGGTVEVKSQLNKGSSFIISLPYEK